MWQKVEEAMMIHEQMDLKEGDDDDGDDGDGSSSSCHGQWGCSFVLD